MGRADLKTGFSCNNRCVFCVQGEKRSRFSDKSTEELRTLLGKAREEADAVVFTGGEVTLRKDLPVLVAHAKDLGFRVIQIQTNGRMLSYGKFAAQLVRAGATEFSPAIHGPNAEIHDTQARARGAFDQTVRGIRNVKRMGRPVLMNSVITRANYEHLPAMASLFMDLGVDQFQFAFVHALGTAAAHFDEVVPRLADVQPYVLEALEIGRQARVPCMTEAIPLCFLPGYERFAAEFIIPRTRVFDAEWVIEDYTDYRLAEGKAKGPPCSGCHAEPACEGAWREYPERFGWDEFEPVTGPIDLGRYAKPAT